MLNVIAVAVVMLVFGPLGQTGVFPPIDSVTPRASLDDHRREWYSKHLDAMADRALPTAPGETYRLLWLRTFHLQGWRLAEATFTTWTSADPAASGGSDWRQQ